MRYEVTIMLSGRVQLQVEVPDDCGKNKRKRLAKEQALELARVRMGEPFQAHLYLAGTNSVSKKAIPWQVGTVKVREIPDAI